MTHYGGSMKLMGRCLWTKINEALLRSHGIQKCSTWNLAIRTLAKINLCLGKVRPYADGE